MPKLTDENQRLRKTVSQLTSQLENTEKKYEDELSARKGLEETRDAKIKEVETSWSAVLTEKQDNWEAKEKSLEEKVENQDRLLKELKASYEVSQRLGRGEDDDEEKGRGGATAAELEIVSSELDRANTRLAEVEARNEQLRLELAQSASNANTQASVPVEEDPTFRRLQSENQSLLRKLDAARYEKDSERRKQETEARKLEKEVATLKQDRDALREKVNSWGDYENVKRELEVLKVSTICSINDPRMLKPPSQSNSRRERMMTWTLLMTLQLKELRALKARERHWNSSCLHGTRNLAMS